jgi:ADP-ribose pyrophosphatase
MNPDTSPDLLTQFVFPRECACRHDVALVFGSRHHVIEIAERAVALWKGGHCKHVLFSGYAGEARRLAAAALDLGLPLEAIHVEITATNTRENVERSIAALTRLSAGKSVVCVAKQHALARTLLTARKLLPDWSICGAAVNYWNVGRADWRSNPVFVAKVRNELGKLPTYINAGHVSPAEAIFDLEQLLESCPKPTEDQIQGEGPTSPRVLSSTIADGPAFEDFAPSTLCAEVSLAGATSNLRMGVLKRPDAIGCVLYSLKDDAAVLVEQFRPGPYVRDQVPSLREIVAGYVDHGEGIEAAVRREVFEEIGRIPDELFPITSFYPAPTLSNEMLHLWCGIIRSEMPENARIVGDTEHLNVRSLAIPAVRAALADGRISNALTLIGLSWLIQNRSALRIEAVA